MRGWPVSAAGLMVTAALAQAHGVDWRRPWSEPEDSAAAAERSDEYAWRLFVALNWPTDTVARKADGAARFGEGPVVWESWQNAEEVYRLDGADPGAWQSGRGSSAPATQARFETTSLKDLPNARHMVGGTMVPWVDPLESAKRLTEIRMNRMAYEYIRVHELFNADGQLRAAADPAGIVFPAGSREVKAKWRRIDAAERSRYHTLQVTLADGSTRLYGLTALHIASKDLPTWFWATFEHVDNPSRADSDHWQIASRDTFACRGGATDCNRFPAHIGLEGTVWQYYRLRGTLTRFVDSAGEPQRLANSELETGFQMTASCITCHARASIALRPGVSSSPAEALRLPIFDGPDRQGFLGLPAAAWFAPDGSNSRFVPLDFVWSLSKAHWRGVHSDDEGRLR